MIVIPFAIVAIESDEDRNYMEWLYVQHRGLMLSTAWKYSSDPFEVEDVVSDSIVSLIKKIDYLKTMEIDTLRRYIVSTVRNTSINCLKKKKRMDERFVLAEDALLLRIVGSDNVVQKVVLHDELIATLHIIHTLPPKEREVLRMKCLDGLTNDEISQITGLAHESIRKYLSRARDKVRSALYERKEVVIE